MLHRISIAVGAAVVAGYAPYALAALTLDDARRLALEGRPALERAHVRHEVTGAWLSAWGASRTANLVRALRSEYRRGVDAATASVAAGRGTLADVYAARELLHQSEDRLLQLAQLAERSGAELERWTGQPGATPSDVAPRWAEPPPLAELLARPRLTKDQRHDLQAAYGEWRLAGERLANFDAKLLPDAQARIEMLYAGYAAGRTDLAAVFEARQALAENLVRRAALEEARARARARIESFEP